MQPNAVNFNEAETNFRTYYGNQILGFPSKYMVAFDFDTVREDGRRGTCSAHKARLATKSDGSCREVQTRRLCGGRRV